MRPTAALLAATLLLPLAGRAQSPVFAAIRAQNWPAADLLARQSPDPLAAKLVRYLRLLAPGQAVAPEIGDFLDANPTWPQQPLLRRRLADAIAATGDDEAARILCEAYKPVTDTALLRCATAERTAGNAVAAADLARRAWIAGLTSPSAEAAFLHDWASSLNADTEWRRFDALAWAHDPAAARQAGRVDAARTALADTRLALAANDPQAAALLAQVPPPQRADPALLLDQARWLRAQNNLAPALALWRAQVAAAEALAPADRRPAFWAERDRLARALLTQGDADGAYFLADDPHVGHDQAADAYFLGGWIALRKLHDPTRAAAHFLALAGTSVAVITQGRAHYWLGRAASDPAAARAAFTEAARYPTSWYGQLAAARLNTPLAARLRALPPPAIPPGAETAFDAAELVHAAVLLDRWGDAPDARLFLLHTARTRPDAVICVLTARRALAMGLPDVAVQAARLAGRIGVALPDLGWPAPFQPPPGVDAPLALGLMRQESSFDPEIISGAGAVGLMQLLPGTARQMQAGRREPPAALTDPATNMRLGVAYLQSLLAEFDGVRPYALAAYNAGPHRVREWLQDNGDPAADGDADATSARMIDWIEQIPFAETRNYVQRVLEAAAIYQALGGK